MLRPEALPFGFEDGGIIARHMRMGARTERAAAKRKSGRGELVGKTAILVICRGIGKRNLLPREWFESNNQAVGRDRAN
jgi:hypothetical protein